MAGIWPNIQPHADFWISTQELQENIPYFVGFLGTPVKIIILI